MPCRPSLSTVPTPRIRQYARRIFWLLITSDTLAAATVVHRHSGPLTDRLQALGGQLGYTAPGLKLALDNYMAETGE